MLTDVFRLSRPPTELASSSAVDTAFQLDRENPCFLLIFFYFQDENSSFDLFWLRVDWNDFPLMQDELIKVIRMDVYLTAIKNDVHSSSVLREQTSFGVIDDISEFFYNSCNHFYHKTFGCASLDSFRMDALVCAIHYDVEFPAFRAQRQKREK